MNLPSPYVRQLFGSLEQHSLSSFHLTNTIHTERNANQSTESQTCTTPTYIHFATQVTCMQEPYITRFRRTLSHDEAIHQW